LIFHAFPFKEIVTFIMDKSAFGNQLEQIPDQLMA
jgi:hypothetical protein